MKKTIVLITLSTVLILIGCNKKTRNTSRQFENKININALTSEGEEINLNIRSYYRFISISNMAFDDNGRWVDKNENKNFLVEAIIRSSVRSVLSTYASKELYAIEKRTFEEEIYQMAKSSYSKSEDGFKVQFNRFLIGEIKYPHLVNQAKSNNLLNEFELLKSHESDLRLKGIEKLLKDGTETSYSIILDHWAKEKNETIRDYILKSLSNKK